MNEVMKSVKDYKVNISHMCQVGDDVKLELAFPLVEMTLNYNVHNMRQVW